jgi:hypothetical protein
VIRRENAAVVAEQTLSAAPSHYTDLAAIAPPAASGIDERHGA